ncbi:MAG: YraN family protein [Campylobacteraceae bacterium]|jgi:putative endonuclease|nr:YraN family protein [Campylobacteraceae bacterium]
MFFKIFARKKDKTPAWRQAEEKAARFLEKAALKIVARNYHSRFGEIDIIAEEESVVHFVEVKATSGSYDPLERITSSKMEKITKTIEYYILKNGIKKEYQIDAVVVTNSGIEWIKNIF